MKRFFGITIFLIASISFFSCESTQIESVQAEENAEWKFLEPENSKPIASGQTKITFKTDKPKAAVYVNKNFQGLTPLEINDLIPGDYFVTIKKEEYKKMQIAIQIKDGVSDYYYLEMEIEDSEQGQ